jgi:hypothetical protein
MILDKYIEELIKFRDNNEGSGKLDVITSKDDEGNGYNEVYYEPTIGCFDGDDFTSDNEEDEFDEDSINSVCVN